MAAIDGLAAEGVELEIRMKIERSLVKERPSHRGVQGGVHPQPPLGGYSRRLAHNDPQAEISNRSGSCSAQQREQRNYYCQSLHDSPPIFKNQGERIYKGTSKTHARSGDRRVRADSRGRFALSRVQPTHPPERRLYNIPAKYQPGPSDVTNRQLSGERTKPGFPGDSA
jgi:hypothetical protein